MNALIVIIATLVTLGVANLAGAQVTCFQYGKTLSCDGPKGNTSITELSRGQGIIQTPTATIPYSIIGQDRERSTYRSAPIEPLERLPSSSSYGGSSIYDHTTFEQREAIRDSGRIPW